MLESMRSHAQGWIAKIILGGIALSFVLWGVGDYFLGGQAEPVAKVNGKPIDQNEFYVAYQRQINSYRAMLGKQFSKELVESLNLKEITLQTMINRRIMLDTANDLGLVAPASLIASQIQTNPSFQSAGVFDVQRYHVLTRNMGFGSAQDYESEMSLNLLVDSLQQAMTESVVVTDAELRDAFNREYEQRVLSAIVVDPASMMKQVKVNEDDAKVWYEANKQSYRSPLRIRLNLAEISPDEVAKDISISDAEVQAAYEERKNQYKGVEERKARHILIKAKGDKQADMMKAREEIEAVKARLKSGEDFAKLAKELSNDLSNADKGGDLGWIRQGTMEPVFENAVFAMNKGEVSDIVEGDRAYHLIELEDIRVQGGKEESVAKAELAAELKRARIADEVYKLSQDLDEALGMEDNLKAAAESINLKLQALGPISMSEAIAQPLLSDANLRARAFATMPGQAVEIHEVGNGRYVALEVLERIDPEVLPFSDVAEKAMEDARRDAANKEAVKLADEIRSVEGKSLDALAQQYGQAKFISKPIRSNGVGDQAAWLSGGVVAAAFQGVSGKWLDRSFRVPQGVAVVRVDEVIAPSDDEFNAQRESLEKSVRQSKGDARYARWMATMRDTYEIETNPAVVERM